MITTLITVALLIYFFVQSKFNSSDKAYNELRDGDVGR